MAAFYARAVIAIEGKTVLHQDIISAYRTNHTRRGMFVLICLRESLQARITPKYGQ